MSIYSNLAGYPVRIIVNRMSADDAIYWIEWERSFVGSPTALAWMMATNIAAAYRPDGVP